MIGIFLCILAFGLTNAMTRRSLGAGLVALMTVGYAYGLIRARVPDGGTHFIFDAALMGLYARAFSGLISAEMRLRTETATWWTLGLMAWPIICMFYAPLVTDDAQPLIIQLVGLRGAVLMLPCLVLGARLKRADFDILAPALAVLNLVALAFALLEYFFGIETFIPHNAVSDIIYESTVITNSGEAFLRIPSTFLSSHAYGGMMTLSVAYIAHGLEMAGRARLLCLAGLGAAILGVFMCGSRLPVVELTLATIYVLGSFRMRSSTVFAFALTALAVSYVVVNFERFQRFETLSDPDAVRSRISMSVNMSFFEILNAYPLGAGLASGFGTSVPYFLLSTPGIHNQVGLESEYSHIVMEQGVVGLGLWLTFIVFSTFRGKRVRECSPTATAYMRVILTICWFSGLLGAGLLSSIPGTALLLAAMGLGLAAPVEVRAKRAISSQPSHTSAGRTAIAVQRAIR
ncbi:MAG: hypothetical protein ACLQVI_30980 [Polyangiaceae bacterium]